MAKYGLKYRAGFHDIFGKYHEAIVYKKGHAGAGNFVNGGAEPVEIKFNGNDEDVFEPIRASELTLNLKATYEGQFDELYGANDRDYRLDLHPPSSEASAMFALEEVDETSLADPYVHLRYDATAVQARVPAYAEVNCTKQIYAGFNGKVRIYAKNSDYQKTLISSIDVVLLNSIDTVHNKIVNDITNRNGDFSAQKIDGKVRIYANTTHNVYNGVPVVVETNTSFIQFEKTPFQGGVEGTRIYLNCVHPTPDPVPNDWWYTNDLIVDTRVFPGQTLEDVIDNLVADYPKPSGEFSNITINAEKLSANEMKITLQGAGSFGEGWKLASIGLDYEYYQDAQWIAGEAFFYGGSSESNISTLQVDKADGNGWTDIASYTRQAGDTLETIINRLVYNVNATAYTAVKRADNMLVIYAPTGDDVSNWNVRWHFVGNNKGSASGFSFVNYDKVDWTGYVIPGMHVQPHDFPPFDVTISATDGLADLKTKNLEDILTSFDRISELDLIAAVLQQTGLNLNIRESVNLYELSYAQTAADSSLKQTHIPAILFRGKNLYDTLKLLLERWLARICQVDGQWVIERIPEKASNYATRTFAPDGRFLSNNDSTYEQSVITGTQGGGHIMKHTSPVPMVGAVKSVTTRLDYGLKEQLINFPNFEEGWDEVWSGRIGFMRTDESGSGLVIIADNEGYDWGHENGYAKQTFSIYNSSNQEYRFSTKYYYREKYDEAIAIDSFKMIVKLTGTDDTPYWLKSNGTWSATEQEITCDIEYQKRNEINIDIPSLPDSGDVSVYVHELDGNSYHEVLIDYVKFEILDDFPSGEHVELGYEKNIVVKKIFSYDGENWTVETKLPEDTYLEKKEVNFVAGDAPSIDNRENMYTNCTTTPDGEFTFGWGAGDPLSSIIRNELLNQLGTYSARIDANMVADGFKYNRVLLDTELNNKKFLPTSITYSVMSGEVKGTIVEIGKAIPSEPKKEYFKPWKEASSGNAAYSVNNTQAGSNVSVAIPPDVLRKRDVVNALTNSSTTNPLSAAMGKELKRLVDKADLSDFLFVGGEPGAEYLYSELPIASAGGITAYSETAFVSTIWESLPIASATIKGGVKIGEGINVDSSGVISVDSTSLSPQTLGLVGNTLSISGGNSVDLSGLSPDLTGYATETWVSSNYLSKTGKAADSDKLDGLDSSAFIKANTSALNITGTISASSTIYASGGNSSNWNAAYAHSQVTSGNPHGISLSDIGESLASINYWTKTGSNLVYGSGEVIIQSPSTTAWEFEDLNLKLGFSNQIDNQSFAGIAFRTSASDNYGFSLHSQRTTSGLGNLHLNFHANKTNGTNLITVDRFGNVGIGTTDPTTFLNVEAAKAGNFITNLVNTDNGSSSNGLRVEVSNNSANNTVQRWVVNGSEVARVQADGNVGIGTTSPDYPLDVNGTIRGTGNIISNGDVIAFA